MSEIFHIKKEAIKKLDDEQARELVARLAKAECRANRASEASVTWGGDQRAKDGGVDVRVRLPATANNLDFIPKPSTAFQVKAEQFPPSKIDGEISPGGKSRDIYDELASEGGAYVIVSSKDDCSKTALDARVKAMSDTLNNLGFASSIKADFYCSRRLADWVEKYPAVVTWVRREIGEPLHGWRPYGAWAYRENDVAAEYLIDDKVRVFMPGKADGQNIEMAVAELRTRLSRPSVTRIVGLSGVGKTRLVQALFDARVFPSQQVPSAENVIYCDLSDSPEPQPSALIEALSSVSADSVVVVDNCSPAEHERLSERVLRSGNKLKLLTIEYDLRDDIPEGTSVYRLEGSSHDTIYKLLKRNYTVLSDADANRIAEYSDGNARIAFALAGTAESAGDFARLRSSELFARLFHQKNVEDDGLLRSAEAASLMYSFNGEDVSPNSELSLLASFAEVTVPTFRRHMSELHRRGLLQSRNEWRAVLPHAIANSLCGRALESLNPEDLKSRLFLTATERVARSFSRRLGFLHECHTAVEIAQALLSSNGPLSNILRYDDYQQQMFEYLAPLSPDSALDRIEEAQRDGKFVSIENYEREKFIKLAFKIAYEPRYFDRAIKIIRAFAVAEPADYNREPARAAFTTLFHVLLSGTHASLAQRHRVAVNLLHSAEESDRKFGIEALAAGLKATHFSAPYSGDFGSHHRDYGWRPSTREQTIEWFQTWLTLCSEMMYAEGEPAQRAQIILAGALRGLWGIPEIRPIVSDLVRKLAERDPWPEGWRAVKQILRWDKKSLKPEDLEKLRALEEVLRPRDLESEILGRIFARGTFTYDDEDDDGGDAVASYYNEHQRAATLGEKAGGHPDTLKALLPQVIESPNGGSAFSFGQGVGKTLADPREYLEIVRDVVAQQNPADVSLIVVRGLISGWSQVAPEAVEGFLDDALLDEVWKRWFVELQIQIPMGKRAFERLIKALTEGRTPVWQYAYLAGGRATDAFTPEQIAELGRELIKHELQGISVAFDVMAMAVHCTNGRDELYTAALREVLTGFLCDVDWSLVEGDKGNTDYRIGVVLDFVLSGTVSDPTAKSILAAILEDRTRPSKIFHRNNLTLLAPFFKYFPRISLDTIYRPDKDGRYSSAHRLVTGFSERENSALWNVPDDILLEWCNISPSDRYPFAAATCRLFETDDKNENQLGISQIAIALMTNAPDRDAIMREYLGRFHPSSWSGSLADILAERQPLLSALNPFGDPTIERIISDAQRELQRWIDAERLREEKRERDDSGSFE